MSSIQPIERLGFCKSPSQLHQESWGESKSQVTRFVLGSQDESREMSGHKYPLLPFHFFALAWPCV